MLRSVLCDYSDVYIVVKSRITVEGPNPINRRNIKLTFKNIAPFRSWISKTNNKFLDNSDLDIIMQMYNLLEYSNNYSIMSEAFWNYEVNDATNEIVGNRKLNNNKITTSKSKYKTKIIGITQANN